MLTKKKAVRTPVKNSYKQVAVTNHVRSANKQLFERQLNLMLFLPRKSYFRWNHRSIPTVFPEPSPLTSILSIYCWYVSINSLYFLSVVHETCQFDARPFWISKRNESDQLPRTSTHYLSRADDKRHAVTQYMTEQNSLELQSLRDGRSGDRIPLGARFSAPFQTGPGTHPASYTMGTGSLPGVKRPGRGADHPPPSSAEGEGRVELYICPASGPSWPVLGRTLPLPFYTFTPPYIFMAWSGKTAFLVDC